MKTIVFLFLVVVGHVGATTVAAVSSSYTDVNSAVLAAARGDTVTVPAGTSNWGNNTLVLSKGVWLKGPGYSSLTITGQTASIGDRSHPGSGDTYRGLIDVTPDATAIANEETIRITGFTFDARSVPNSTSDAAIQVHGAGAGSSKPFKNLAIGQNKFFLVVNNTRCIFNRGQTRGVIYNNVFDRCNIILGIFGNNDPNEHANGHFPFAYGNADNLFFEGNTIGWSALSGPGGDSFGAPGYTEVGQGGRVVIRYNTWNMTNVKSYDGLSTNLELWDAHGFQNWRSNNGANGQTGQMIYENYGNTVIGSQCGDIMPFRGSWGMIHNNIITGSNSNELQAKQYGDGTLAEMSAFGGSGCTHAVPGASGIYITEINNSYCFNNTLNAVQQNLLWRGLGDGCMIAENASFWNYNASFGNGTNGIGRGTSVPVTTGNPNGSGYWVNTTVTPTADPTIVQTGHLYKRVSGSWVDYYTPYTYPHPLRDTGTPVPTPTPSSTPPAPLLFIQLFPDV